MWPPVCEDDKTGRKRRQVQHEKKNTHTHAHARLGIFPIRHINYHPHPENKNLMWGGKRESYLRDSAGENPRACRLRPRGGPRWWRSSPVTARGGGRRGGGKEEEEGWNGMEPDFMAGQGGGMEGLLWHPPPSSQEVMEEESSCCSMWGVGGRCVGGGVTTIMSVFWLFRRLLKYDEGSDAAAAHWPGAF